VSPIEEFTYLSPNRFVGTTQAERKPHAESYWENGDAEFSAGLGGESFNHLLERVDAMLAKLADYDAQNILAFNRQLDVSVTALKQSDTQRAFQHLLVRSH